MISKKTNLFVYAAIVALIGGYALYDNYSSEKQEKIKTETSRIVPMEKEQIAKLSLQFRSDHVELEKTVDGWKMISPFQDLGNNPVIEEFIDGLVSEKYSGIAAEGNFDQKTYGLEKPKGEFVITSNSGKTISIKIGHVKNFQGDSFLLLGDSGKVMIGSSTWQTKAEKTAVEFRDRRLMRKSNSKTDAVKVIFSGTSYLLEKKDSKWKLKEHPDWNLDQNKVREFLNKLNVTDAIEFVGEGKPKASELKKWGFLKPELLSIETYSEGQMTWSAKIAQGNDKVTRALVSSPEFILKIAPSEMSSLAPEPEKFRDKSEPFQFSKEKVKKIVIHQGSDKIELEASSVEAHNLLKDLQKLELDRFESKVATDYENSIELLDQQGQEQFKFQWSKVIEVKDKTTSRNVVYGRSSSYSGDFSLLESEIGVLKLDELKNK